jgi:hypothetical protein
MKHIKDKTGVIMKAIDGKDGEKRLKILIGGTETRLESLEIARRRLKNLIVII